MSYIQAGGNFLGCPSYIGLTAGGSGPPPPPQTGFLHGGQYLLTWVNPSGQFIRFGWQPMGTSGPPPMMTGFPQGGQLRIVSTTQMFIRFGWAFGSN